MLSSGLALLAGLAIALMDSSRGFDATGLTAAGLIGAGSVAALVDGSGSFVWAAVLAAFAGGSIVLLESQALPASALAFVFAGIGAFVGAWSRRLLQEAADA